MSDQVLITGPPGSGKTFLAADFLNRGLNAVDADEISGLQGWFNDTGQQVVFPEDANTEFLTSHRFLWNRHRLQRFLAQQSDVLVFGLADNVFEMVDLFSRAYFLSVAPEALIERLMHPSRSNPMGKTAEQQQEVLKYAHVAQREAPSHGFVVLNGAMSPAGILQSIAV